MANATKPAVHQPYPGSGGGGGGQGFAELWKVFSSEAVATTATVDSIMSDTGNLGFRLHEFKYFGLWSAATSASGTADVKAQILQSYDDTAANYVVPDVGGTLTASIADDLPHVFAISPTVMPFLRIRLIGNAANPADTVVTGYVFFQS